MLLAGAYLVKYVLNIWTMLLRIMKVWLSWLATFLARLISRYVQGSRQLTRHQAVSRLPDYDNLHSASVCLSAIVPAD